MEFAISLWAPDTSNEAIRSLLDQGVTAAEPGPPFLLQEDEQAFLAAVQRFHAAGIRFHACHAPFGEDDDLSHLEEEPRLIAVATHRWGLERAALAGAACMVIHPGRGIPPEEEPQRIDRLCASLEALLRTAEDTGVRLALENMLPGHVACDGSTVRRIVDHFDSPYLGVCLDTGHAHVTDEGVDAAYAILRDRTITFHLADNDGHRDQHSQPPYGTIDWASFAHAFGSMGFAAPVTVEAPPWNRASSSTLLREMRSLFEGELLATSLGGRQVWAMCSRCGHYLFGSAQAPVCACDA